jgi:hypothetical protein
MTCRNVFSGSRGGWRTEASWLTSLGLAPPRFAFGCHKRLDSLQRLFANAGDPDKVIDRFIRPAGNNLSSPGRPDIRNGLEFLPCGGINVDDKRAGRWAKVIGDILYITDEQDSRTEYGDDSSSNKHALSPVHLSSKLNNLLAITHIVAVLQTHDVVL